MEKSVCKKCSSDHCIKNGKVRDQQRYQCKACGFSFIEGDRREKFTPETKALSLLLYGRGRASYGFIARLFNVSSVSVMKMLKHEANKMPEPAIDSSIKEVSFDGMCHFVNQKKENYGCGVQWSAVATELSAGLPEIVLLRHSNGFTGNLNI